LIKVVLEKQAHEFEPEFCNNVQALLDQLLDDFRILNFNDWEIFQESLNIAYLRQIASETGKNYLKEIEQLFQDERPEQAMASIQTNHFLYIYLEMLNRIWSFLVGVEPICTWPAFNSTMQMHHDIFQNIGKWHDTCENLKKEQETKASSMGSSEDEKKRVNELKDNLEEMQKQIGLILTHMSQFKCLKYAGKEINEMQKLVTDLSAICDTTNQISNDVSGVFKTYCQVKCSDNKDKMLSFPVSKNMETTENNVKTVTEAILLPSAYQDYENINVPSLYFTNLNNLFTVKTGGNVVLSKYATCQQIINLTLTNFGIMLRNNSSLDDSEKRRRHVKASLGIITNSSDDAYLDYYQRMPFQKKKIEGSWEITLDTDSSLSNLRTDSTGALDKDDALNMFFDDDVLELSPTIKMHLLRKFIGCKFFEYRGPDAKLSTEQEYLDRWFKFQTRVFSVRIVSCIEIIQAEFEGGSDIHFEEMYEKLYGTYDGCERIIAMHMATSKDSMENEEITELETKDDNSRWGLLKFAQKVGTSFMHFIKSSKKETPQVSEMFAESEMGIKSALEEAKKLKNECKVLAQKAAKEKDRVEKDKLNAQVFKNEYDLQVILNGLIPYLEKQCRDKTTKAAELQIAKGRKDTNADEKIKHEQLFQENNHEFEILLSALLEAEKLQDEYGTWAVQRVGDSVDNTGVPIMRLDSTLDASGTGNTLSAQPSAQQLSDGRVDQGLQTRVPGSSERSDQRVASEQTPTQSSPDVSAASGDTPGPSAESPAASRATNANEGAQTADSSENTLTPSSATQSKTNVKPAATLNENASVLESSRPAAASAAGSNISNFSGFMQSSDTSQASDMVELEQAREAGAVSAARQGASNAESLLPIAPFDKIESAVHDYSTTDNFTPDEIDRIAKQPELQAIFLPENIGGFEGKARRNPPEAQFIFNIVAYWHVCVKNKETYEFLPEHAFVLVNSTRNTREVARSLLGKFAKETLSNVDKVNFCLDAKFQDCLIPEWIGKSYLKKIKPYLPKSTSIYSPLQIEYILNLDQSKVFDDRKLTENPQNKLKARYLLYVALIELKIRDLQELRLEAIKSQTPNQRSTSRGLFTQPPLWCDDGADESPAASAGVCCRCGMCPSVVQNVQKTGLLVCGTAPPTYPLLNTFSIHPPYSAPNKLVFAAAPMQGMVPNTQARQVYILRL
jgi:hypothetical protein